MGFNSAFKGLRNVVKNKVMSTESIIILYFTQENTTLCHTLSRVDVQNDYGNLYKHTSCSRNTIIFLACFANNNNFLFLPVF